MDNINQVVQTPPNLPPEHSSSRGLKIAVLILIALIVLVGGAFAYYYYFIFPKESLPITLVTPPTTTTPIDTSTSTIPTETTTSTPTSTPDTVTFSTVEKELPEVTNAKDFQFSPTAKNLLVKNNFVVVPAYFPEFFSLYESNRYDQVPNFITTDSILHNYHLMFDQLLKQLEEEKLAPELKKLNASLLAKAETNYTAVKGTLWENAAKRTLGFFTVGNKLLDTTTKTNSLVKTQVDKELSLIEAHNGIDTSAVMNIGSSATPESANREDYSQYIARGHYTKSDLLTSYFKSMMWYGRLTFRFDNDDEIKSAVLITTMLNDATTLGSWEKIYEPTSFLVGKSDDVTFYQMKEVIEKVYGKNPTTQTILKDANKFPQVVALVKKLEPPQINSIPIFNSSIQPDRNKVIQGFRFMGQRFTVDASIFQRLIDREVSTRMLPKGLDIPAALGSDEAYSILKSLGEDKYTNYTQNMDKLRSYFASVKTDTWTQNIYWNWMYTLLPLTEDKSKADQTNTYPTFMKNQAWTRKDLNTFLGSWTELKHDTILYAKQAYSEMGGGDTPGTKKDDRGYVEPNRDVYYRLVGLVRKTRDGLGKRNLLTPALKNQLDKMDQLALALKDISEKELASKTLTDQEFELIRTYGGQLEHMWLDINKADMEAQKLTEHDFLDNNPASLVTDVATNPGGEVLQEGTGNISEIYALVPIEGKLRIARGGVFSYYEFTQPLSDRLTDEKWREMLKSISPTSATLPFWTESFTAPRQNPS
jgi:hypothetical protein